jgi:hypothetical protein
MSAPVWVYCENPTVVEDLSLKIHTPSQALQPAVADAEYRQAIVSEGGAHPVSWEVLSGALPDGVSLEPGDPNALLSGTPDTQGHYTFELQVADQDGNNVSRQFSLEVLPYEPLVQ